MSDDDAVPEDEPFAPFARWFRLADEREPLAEAMIVATTSLAGRPSARALLLKGVDPRGFVFYTNFESRKAEELLSNPHAALCFHWKSLGRQVRVEGRTEIVTPEEADAYFASRARESRLGAWASAQSRPLGSREQLAEAFAAAGRTHPEPGAVPRPPYWSGFRLLPETVEFWQDRPHRLHDRVVFHREAEAWHKQRLFP